MYCKKVISLFLAAHVITAFPAQELAGSFLAPPGSSAIAGLSFTDELLDQYFPRLKQYAVTRYFLYRYFVEEIAGIPLASPALEDIITETENMLYRSSRQFTITADELPLLYGTVDFMICKIIADQLGVSARSLAAYSTAILAAIQNPPKKSGVSLNERIFLEPREVTLLIMPTRSAKRRLTAYIRTIRAHRETSARQPLRQAGDDFMSALVASGFLNKKPDWKSRVQDTTGKHAKQYAWKKPPASKREKPLTGEEKNELLEWLDNELSTDEKVLMPFVLQNFSAVDIATRLGIYLRRARAGRSKILEKCRGYG